MTVVPPDPKTPYLMKTEVITAEESPDGKLTWNLLLSSSHLIEEFLKDGQEELICMDHTHSLCVENCPVMFVGRVSRAGHFCPFGIVIGNKEAASNSKFVLEWIRDNCSVPPSPSLRTELLPSQRRSGRSFRTRCALCVFST